MFATSANNIAIVTALIKRGANLNMKKGNGVTALMIAVKRGYTSIINALLEAHADVNAQNTKTGWTALIFATSANDIAIVTALIKRGANLNMKKGMV
jgi:ankyrin repeat protein